MRTNLNVPIEERYAVRNLGASWDPARKVWFVADGVDLTPFLKWVPGLGKDWKKWQKVASHTGTKWKKERRW